MEVWAPRTIWTDKGWTDEADSEYSSNEQRTGGWKEGWKDGWGGRQELLVRTEDGWMEGGLDGWIWRGRGIGRGRR